jgi:hypothetical protein
MFEVEGVGRAKELCEKTMAKLREFSRWERITAFENRPLHVHFGSVENRNAPVNLRGVDCSKRRRDCDEQPAQCGPCVRSKTPCSWEDRPRDTAEVVKETQC